MAVAPVDGDDPDALLHSADTAMYSATQAGSDRRVHFRAAWNQAAEDRAGLRHDLAEALRAPGSGPRRGEPTGARPVGC